MPRRYFIKTYGCKMNEYDSARMADVLESGGDLKATDDPAEADVLLSNVAPQVLARLLGEPIPGPAPEGAQLKLNLLLARLPRLRDASVDPRDAFAGTFHVNESACQLQKAYEEAESGRIPTLAPCEKANSSATRWSASTSVTAICTTRT